MRIVPEVGDAALRVEVGVLGVQLEGLDGLVAGDGAAGRVLVLGRARLDGRQSQQGQGEGQEGGHFW